MGFFEGFKASLSERESVELFAKEYERWALSQPDDVMITFFQGYRAAPRLTSAAAKAWHNDECMFSRFSGEELPANEKLAMIGRAIYHVEMQPNALKREAGSPLNLPYFHWDEEKEAAANKASLDSLKAAVRDDPFLRQSLVDMGFEFE